MLKIAQNIYANKVLNHDSHTHYIQKDIISYLENNNALDLIICKYVLGGIPNSAQFFAKLYAAMEPGGVCFIDVAKDTNELKSYTTNARNLLNGQEFPLNETRTLKEGDIITTKFFTISGDPNSGHMDGIEQIRYYRSHTSILEQAQRAGFEAEIKDWKSLCNNYNHIGYEDFNFSILKLQKI